MTEKLLTGTLSLNTTNQQLTLDLVFSFSEAIFLSEALWPPWTLFWLGPVSAGTSILMFSLCKNNVWHEKGCLIQSETRQDQSSFSVSKPPLRPGFIIYEPCHEKTCLRGFRPGKTQNLSAQLQKLARGMKLTILKLAVLYYLANNKGADQTAPMRRLICAFVVCIWHKQVFS